MTDEPRWARDRQKPPAWISHDERVAFENPWLKVTVHAATAPTGRPATYGVVRFANHAVGVVPLHADGTVTLVGQRRFPLGDYSWELPEGGAPKSEDPLEGARRELREETGLQAGRWAEILRMQLSNSVTDELAFVYLATDLSGAGETDFDETERLEVVRVPFRDLLDEVLAGRVQDSLTVAGALRVHHMAVTGALDPELARAVLG